LNSLISFFVFWLNTTENIKSSAKKGSRGYLITNSMVFANRLSASSSDTTIGIEDWPKSKEKNKKNVSSVALQKK
jgi:hypothetical protein